MRLSIPKLCSQLYIALVPSCSESWCIKLLLTGTGGKEGKIIVIYLGLMFAASHSADKAGNVREKVGCFVVTFSRSTSYLPHFLTDSAICTV